MNTTAVTFLSPFSPSDSSLYIVIIEMKAKIYIGTSGWHYPHWLGLFYPPEIKGYYELQYYSKHFNAVENNSSFYRIASEATYKTWAKMVPEDFKFSMKLNKLITHTHQLELTDEVTEKICYILSTTEVLGPKLGALLIQLPPSFKYDLQRLDTFLSYFQKEIKKRKNTLDVAIEFRNRNWFNDEAYNLLKKHNVAIVAAQSSRYPNVRVTTADFAYIRMHGPEKLFSSTYTREQLEEWAMYIRSLMNKTQRIYVFFNNDFHGYALKNAEDMITMLT